MKSMDPSSRIEAVRLAHALMFGDRAVNPLQRPLMTYTALSKILKCSINTVKGLLRGPRPSPSPFCRPKPHHMQKLTTEHMVFLLHEDQL